MTQPIIELHKLEKTFAVGFFRKQVQAVRSIDLQVMPGEVFGLVGPNGAGKTTTIKMMNALITPTGGSVQIMGKDPRDKNCRKLVGYLPEVSHYYHYLTASEILHFYAQLYAIDGATRRKLVPELLERVGLANAKEKRLGQFSKGMQQRLGLAQALVGDPHLVILDEPQSGLDPFGRKDVENIINDCRNEGKTVFFSSHILNDVERICDRVALLYHGKIVKVGTMDELLGDKRIVEVHYEGEIEDAIQQELKDRFTLVKPLQTTATGGVISLMRSENAINALLRMLMDADLQIARLTEERETLESLFVRLSEEASE